MNKNSADNSKKVPAKKREASANISVRRRAEMFSGPIPPPKMLAEYNAILPNAAERIISMAEKNLGHTHKMEERIVSFKSRESTLSQILSTFITIISIIAGVIVALFGNLVAGIALITPGGLFTFSFFLEKIVNIDRQRKDKDKNKQ